MRGRARIATPAPTRARHRAGVITWIDSQRAIVARRMPGGTVEMRDFPMPADETERLAALADVALAIGEPDRVLVLGDSALRMLLEREYVTIYRRPDRLEDIEPEGPITRDDLVRQLRDSGD
jgi:hypothetical protein